MAAVYDEIEIEDMEWVAEEAAFYYPCPRGDRFGLSLAELLEGEDIARCPSCSLRIRVIFDPEALEAQYGGASSGGGEEAPAIEAS
jgi:hypothetical protein